MIKEKIKVPINIKNTFEKLQDCFLDLSNRILLCNEFESHLATFKEELEKYDAKYLSWFVSTLKDVFSYNYAEDITEEQLILIKEGINIIYKETKKCDKNSYTLYHLKLVESGLSLLPNSKKAIEKFGK